MQGPLMTVPDTRSAACGVDMSGALLALARQVLRLNPDRQNRRRS